MSLMRQQTVVAGIVLVDVHPMVDCADLPCAIHNPTGHDMESWPLVLRANTTEVLDRVCAHGEHHPDPDQFAFWATHGLESRAVHECDGCCRQQEQEPTLAPDPASDSAVRHMVRKALRDNGHPDNR